MDIQNNKPAVLSPIYTATITGTFDPIQELDKAIIDPLYVPISPAAPVTVTDDGKPLTQQNVKDIIYDCCGDSVTNKAEQKAKELYNKALISFSSQSPLSFQNLFAIQAGTKYRMPFPTNRIIYTAGDDIKPACKQFLAGNMDAEQLFANFAFFARCEAVGFYFASEPEWDAFKQFTQIQLQALSVMSNVSVDTSQMLTQLQAMKLDTLVEVLRIRASETDNNDPYSFARILMSMLMAYAKSRSPELMGAMPFCVSELFCPKSVILINIDAHVKTTPEKIRMEWDLVTGALRTNITVLNNGQINNLTKAQRALSSVTNGPGGKGGDPAKAARFVFKTREPDIKEWISMLTKIACHMKDVLRSENSYKSSTNTFNKANRRDPDNFDKMGKSTYLRYKPDIHVYLDTSGSISEENYQLGIRALVLIAQTLGVDMYFNSFSDVMSSCTKLAIKELTLDAAYAMIQKIPKVSGGTDYEQIWHYINMSDKRSHEISIIMTDFGYLAGNHYVRHPKHLYYMPMSKMNWSTITRLAENFCKSMRNNDPDIRKKCLM